MKNLKEQKRKEEQSQRQRLRRRTVKLPSGKNVGFKLPTTGDPKLKKQFETRKVKIIDEKAYKKGSSANPNDKFWGTLRL